MPLDFTPAGEQSVVVAASPEQVYAVLADPTRVGEWSHEAHGASWLGGATQAAVGAEFEAHNKIRWQKWNARCRVLAAEPGRRFAFHTVADDGSTLWDYQLEPVADGTRITQRFRVVALSRLREVVLNLLVPSHRDRSDALRADLVRLGDVAAREPAAPTASMIG